MLILSCSPHIDGVTESLATFFLKGIQTLNHVPPFIPLRNYVFKGCVNCGACAIYPHACTIKDDAAELYNKVLSASRLVIFSPIYFYNVPAHFKAFIDRSQYLWFKKPAFPKYRPCLVILAAGRLKGDQLFQGTLLTLKYFLENCGFAIQENFLFRGLENIDNITAEMEIELENAGRRWS